jgi:hypothetical protein
MAHYAKIGINSKVLSVEVVADADTYNADNQEDESVGIQFLTRIHGWPLWKKCSYNTKGGKHYDADGNESADQSKAFRKNYPGIGHTWDEDRDAFYAPKPYDSWSLNETTCLWEAPFAMPNDGQAYRWDEATTNWVVVTSE